MKQASFESMELQLTEFEDITARYFSDGKEPSKANIKLAVNKCKQWNDQRIKSGLKPWK